jgi:hypothetical protein
MRQAEPVPAVQAIIIRTRSTAGSKATELIKATPVHPTQAAAVQELAVVPAVQEAPAL